MSSEKLAEKFLENVARIKNASKIDIAKVFAEVSQISFEEALKTIEEWSSNYIKEDKILVKAKGPISEKIKNKAAELCVYSVWKNELKELVSEEMNLVSEEMKLAAHEAELQYNEEVLDTHSKELVQQITELNQLQKDVTQHKKRLDNLLKEYRSVLGIDEFGLTDEEIKRLVYLSKDLKAEDFELCLEGIKNHLNHDPIFQRDVSSFVQEVTRKDLATSNLDMKLSRVLHHFIKNDGEADDRKLLRQIQAFQKYQISSKDSKKPKELTVFATWIDFYIEKYDADYYQKLLWLARWASFGYPEVKLDEKLAAALILTDVPDDIIHEDSEIPWGSFQIQVPMGLLSSLGDDGKVLESAKIRLRKVKSADYTGWWVSTEILGGKTLALMSVTAPTLLALARDNFEVKPPPDEDTKETSDLFPNPKVRNVVKNIMGKLAVGVVLRMSDPSLLRKRSNKARFHGKPTRIGGPPQTTEYVLGGDVKIDCRQVVRDLIAGRKDVKYKKVQWVVRGHWRNQACGKGYSEHYKKWIEPFWKGPEKAPILARSHILNEANKLKKG